MRARAALWRSGETVDEKLYGTEEESRGWTSDSRIFTFSSVESVRVGLWMTRVIPAFEERYGTSRYNVVYRQGELDGKAADQRGKHDVEKRQHTFIYTLIGTLSALLAFPSIARRVTMFSR